MSTITATVRESSRNSRLDHIFLQKGPELTTLPEIAPEVIYPDSDGKPMGETGIHVYAILHLYSALTLFFRQTPDIYIAADMFLYYKKGDPKANKAPDVMVIKDRGKQERRSFKIWEEGVAPCVIFEITSRSTMIEDLVHKGSLYAELGVHEYFVFDPLHEYLDRPALVGFRLEDAEYARLEPDIAGFLYSQELDLCLSAEGKILRLSDPPTKQAVPGLEEVFIVAEQRTEMAEQATQRADQAQQRADQAQQRAEQEAQRAAAAEVEIARLKAMLKDAQ